MEIAFVHDANSDEKKNSLSRKVNAGEFQVLLASTEKKEEQVLNVQSKVKAVHHLDVPWRPSDIQQRNGRIIRQGNENKEVDIYHYIAKVRLIIIYGQLRRTNSVILSRL